jgi:hypothetical protein
VGKRKREEHFVIPTQEMRAKTPTGFY